MMISHACAQRCRNGCGGSSVSDRGFLCLHGRKLRLISMTYQVFISFFAQAHMPASPLQPIPVKGEQGAVAPNTPPILMASC
jgi:hypothetical protein